MNVRYIILFLGVVMVIVTGVTWYRSMPNILSETEGTLTQGHSANTMPDQNLADEQKNIPAPATSSTSVVQTSAGTNGHSTATAIKPSADVTNAGVAYAEWGFDATRPDILVQNSKAVFIGKVIERGKDEIEHVASETRAHPTYSIQVLSNLKGDVQGTVTVVQSDTWYNAKGKLVVLRDGDVAGVSDAFLQVGGMYLLLPFYWDNINGNYYVGMPPYDRTLVIDATEVPNLTSAQVDAAIQNNIRVRQIEEAIAHLKAAPPVVPAAPTGGLQ